MENTFLWAQIIGFVAMSISISAWQIKSSRLILLCGVPSGFLWAIQYLLLGAPIGAIMNMANASKDGILCFIPKKHARLVVATFIAFIFAYGLYSFTHWFDALPLLGAAAINFGLYYDRDNKALFARCLIACQICWFTYNMIVGAYMGVACAILVTTSAFIGMYRHEAWQVGRCYKTFIPSLARSLFSAANLKTHP